MKGTDEVFAAARVDPGFAADGGINLCQQGGRHLNKIDAAQQRSRHVARQIPHDPAAESQQHIAPLAAVAEHLLADISKDRKRLGFLPAGHRNQPNRYPGVCQLRAQPRTVNPPDRLIGNDRQPPGSKLIRPAGHQPIEDTRPDVDGVGPLTKAYFYCLRHDFMT